MATKPKRVVCRAAKKYGCRREDCGHAMPHERNAPPGDMPDCGWVECACTDGEKVRCETVK